MARTFEDLEVFKRAISLMKAVYEVTDGFPQREIYGLASQLRRASISVISQIAEGQGRLSAGEWRQFLSQARGSLFEIEAQIIAARELGFVNSVVANNVRAKTKAAGRPLAGLIAYVRARERRQPGTGNRQPTHRSSSSTE